MKERLFEDLVVLWLKDKRIYVKRSTYAVYVKLCHNQLLPYFSGCNVTEKLVQDFVLMKISQGLSQKYIKDIIVVLKMILRFGVKHGFTDCFNMDIRFPPQDKKAEPMVLSRIDQKKIMEYVTANVSFMNLGVFICLCTGMRIGEICALMWDDIDVKSGVITVSKTVQRICLADSNQKRTEVIVGSPKSRSSFRIIPIPRCLLKVLKPLMKSAIRNRYFLTNQEKPIEPRSYRNFFKRLMDELNIPYVKFHSLRHTFATRCIESRCDYKTVSLLLGHSNLSTTLDMYVHPDITSKRKCVEHMMTLFV